MKRPHKNVARSTHCSCSPQTENELPVVLCTAAPAGKLAPLPILHKTSSVTECIFCVCVTMVNRTCQLDCHERRPERLCLCACLQERWASEPWTGWGQSPPPHRPEDQMRTKVNQGVLSSGAGGSAFPALRHGGRPASINTATNFLSCLRPHVLSAPCLWRAPATQTRVRYTKQPGKVCTRHLLGRAGLSGHFLSVLCI